MKTSKRSTKPIYRSSIPKRAKERVVEKYSNGAKMRCEYFYLGKKVGFRYFQETGELEGENGIRDDNMHGNMYTWCPPGYLMSFEPYKNGVAHGKALQWDKEGKLIGSYKMHHGTGIDLWWQDWGRNHFLLEVHYMKNGRPHGFEWWINDSQRSVWDEKHWHEGKYHGIHRQWNQKRRLHRGYPKYFIHNKQVTKREYVKACKIDPSLPPFRLQDNKPHRKFPPEIREHLSR